MVPPFFDRPFELTLVYGVLGLRRSRHSRWDHAAVTAELEASRWRRSR